MGIPIRAFASGTAVLGVLMALYYSTVVLAGLHFTVLQVITLWGLALMLVPRNWRTLTSAEVGTLLTLTAIFVVALSSYAVNGLWDHPDRNLSRYSRFLFFVPIYFVARRFASAAIFWYALLVGVCVVGMWGLLEFAGLVRHRDDPWPEVSGAVNPIQFGDLSLAMAAMTCAGWPVYRSYGRAMLALAVLGAALALFACIASNTRGAWIAIPVLVTLISVVLVHHGNIRWKYLLTLAAIGILLLSPLLQRTQVPDQIERAVTELRDYRSGTVGPSVGARLELWRASWQIYLDHPVLGVGPGLYFAKAQELKAKGGYDDKALEYSNPLSEYFFALATLGTAGIVALMVLFLWPLGRCAKLLLSRDLQLRSLGLAGSVLVVAYMHFGLTEGMFFQHATFLGFYLLTVAVLMASIERRKDGDKKDARA